jgi:hypothetical protein
MPHFCNFHLKDAAHDCGGVTLAARGTDWLRLPTFMIMVSCIILMTKVCAQFQTSVNETDPSVEFRGTLKGPILEPGVDFDTQTPSSADDTTARKQYTELGNHMLASGFENAPQLFHISRYGTKAIWFSPNEDEMEIKSVSLPSFEQQMAGATPSPIKQILLDPQVNVKDLRAFDTDEVSSMYTQ